MNTEEAQLWLDKAHAHPDFVEIVDSEQGADDENGETDNMEDLESPRNLQSFKAPSDPFVPDKKAQERKHPKKVKKLPFQ